LGALRRPPDYADQVPVSNSVGGQKIGIIGAI